jgi:hypothetical protein
VLVVWQDDYDKIRTLGASLSDAGLDQTAIVLACLRPCAPGLTQAARDSADEDGRDGETARPNEQQNTVAISVAARVGARSRALSLLHLNYY